ncbi:hypothetical protein PDTK01_18830 [Phycicoccus sp. DTK01]|nr:hypothetical protein PDTK01_18830 [Phycicoccus sp. DTK01]
MEEVGTTAGVQGPGDHDARQDVGPAPQGEPTDGNGQAPQGAAPVHPAGTTVRCPARRQGSSGAPHVRVGRERRRSGGNPWLPCRV